MAVVLERRSVHDDDVVVVDSRSNSSGCCCCSLVTRENLGNTVGDDDGCQGAG